MFTGTYNNDPKNQRTQTIEQFRRLEPILQL